MAGLVIIGFVLMALCIVGLVSIAYIFSDDVIGLIAEIAAGWMLATLIVKCFDFYLRSVLNGCDLVCLRACDWCDSRRACWLLLRMPFNSPQGER